MEFESSVAHRLPALYRDALDAVGLLERAGHRAAAARFRQEAQTTYAVRWDEDACRRMEHLAARAREAASPPRTGRGGILRQARLPRP